MGLTRNPRCGFISEGGHRAFNIKVVLQSFVERAPVERELVVAMH
jgi:hypothetical protein